MNFFDESEPFHDVALVCLNGHTVNDSSKTKPQFNKKYCDKCGEATIDSCPSCRKPIQGDYKSPNCFVLGAGEMPAPSFCQECGKLFPWTERRLAAAKEIAGQIEEISDDEKEKLKQTFDDLVREGPRTEPAKLRFKSIIKKIGGESYDILKGVVTDLVSETVRKSIYGP